MEKLAKTLIINTIYGIMILPNEYNRGDSIWAKLKKYIKK